MFEMRERLVRIETKMDSSAEKVEALETATDKHGTRLTALEAEANQLRSSIAVLKWVGGGSVGLLTLFSDKILSLFT